MSFMKSRPCSFSSFKCVCVYIVLSSYYSAGFALVLGLWTGIQIMRGRKVLETSLALILLYFREIAWGYTNPVFEAMELSALHMA